MTCVQQLFQSLFQCCSVDETVHMHELKLTENTLLSPRSPYNKVHSSGLNTELTSQVANSECDADQAFSDRNRYSLHETVQHMCSETATSFGDSLLSFKKAMRQQAQHYLV
mmetsp:Transcript_28776/g.51201  ORF Transcript_28776/g.51201 Transcript_28776/m.51201 type:complete len:111 (-) Transcript_28776:3068-3400(-)